MNDIKSFQNEMMHGYTYLNTDKYGHETWDTIVIHLRKTNTFLGLSGSIRIVLRGVMDK